MADIHRKTIAKFFCAATAICVLSFTQNAVDAQQHSNANAAKNKADDLFGRIIHEHKKVKVTVFGKTHEYSGFPPRRVVEEGTHRFSDLNLYVDVPGYPWLCLAPKNKDSQVSMLCKRSNPKIEVTINAERIATNSKLSAHQLITGTLRKLERNKKFDFESGEWQVEFAGLRGNLYEAYEGSNYNPKKRSLVCVAIHGEHIYSLVVSGKPKESEAIDVTMEEFLSRIKLIEPVRIAKSQGTFIADRRKNKTAKQARPKADKVAWASDTNKKSRSVKNGKR